MKPRALRLDDPRVVGRLLRERREELGWSMAGFAYRTHQADRTIRMRESRGLSTISAIAPQLEALGLEMVILVRERTPPSGHA